MNLLPIFYQLDLEKPQEINVKVESPGPKPSTNMATPKVPPETLQRTTKKEELF